MLLRDRFHMKEKRVAECLKAIAFKTSHHE